MNTVISQALATGLPVVTTRHSGLPDQVTHGVNGFLVEEGDYEGLAAMIEVFVAHPEKWAQFSRAAREHVRQFYDSKFLMRRQLECYRALLGERR